MKLVALNMSNKLHLGNGNVYLKNYINVDLVGKADLYDDVVTLRKLTGQYKEIIACMVLEHLGKFKYKQALKRWYELLEENGKLRITVPDFEAICKYYLETKDLNSLYSALYAGQNQPYNFHYWCWDFETLKRDLEEIGFKNIKRTQPNKVRDWSTNYVPYHDSKGNELPDKEWFKGTNIALNVEASK